MQCLARGIQEREPTNISICNTILFPSPCRRLSSRVTTHGYLIRKGMKQN